MYAPAGGETISCSMSGWLKTGLASAIILLLTSAKKLLTARKNCSGRCLQRLKRHAKQNECRVLQRKGPYSPPNGPQKSSAFCEPGTFEDIHKRPRRFAKIPDSHKWDNRFCV
jgi:hypothetical protein